MNPWNLILTATGYFILSVITILFLFILVSLIIKTIENVKGQTKLTESENDTSESSRLTLVQNRMESDDE